MAVTFARARSQYMSVPYGANLVFTTSMSISAWVNPGTVTMQRVCSRASTATATEIFGLDIYQQNARMILGYSYRGGFLNTQTLYAENTCAGGSVPSGTWSHVVGTWDGANMRVYVNGVLVNTTARTAALLTSTNPLSIGADWQSNMQVSEFFDGSMEDLRLYNRALSANEIQTMRTLRGSDGIQYGCTLSIGMWEGSRNMILGQNSTVRDIGPFGTNASTAVTGINFIETYSRNRRGL